MLLINRNPDGKISELEAVTELTMNTSKHILICYIAPILLSAQWWIAGELPHKHTSNRIS